MKSKILAKLSVKHKGLSKHLLGLIADKIAAKVTEESEIDAAIDDLDNQLISVSEYAKLLQQEGDRRVTEAKKTFEKQSTESDEEEEEEPEAKPKGKEKSKGGDDAIAKLTQAVAALTEKVASNEKQSKQQTLGEKLKAALKEKKIPEVMAKGRALEKEEDIDTVLAEIEADHTALKQELINEGLAGGKPPIVGNGAPADKAKVTADIDAWAKANAPKTDSKTN